MNFSFMTALPWTQRTYLTLQWEEFLQSTRSRLPCLLHQGVSLEQAVSQKLLLFLLNLISQSALTPVWSPLNKWSPKSKIKSRLLSPNTGSKLLSLVKNTMETSRKREISTKTKLKLLHLFREITREVTTNNQQLIKVAHLKPPFS